MSLWPNIDQLPDEKPLWKIPLSYIDGYNSGCIAQAKADREAVRKLLPKGGFCVMEKERGIMDALANLAAAQIVKGE
jgi:hypothetical protein